MAPVTVAGHVGPVFKELSPMAECVVPTGAGAPSCLHADRDTSPHTSPPGSPTAPPGAQAAPPLFLAPVGAGQCHTQLGGQGRAETWLDSSLLLGVMEARLKEGPGLAQDC